MKPQLPPVNLEKLGDELEQRWPQTTILDIFKEAELRIGFTDEFSSVATREVLDRETIRKRLVVALHAIGTNAGLKRARADQKYADLKYIMRRFVTRDAVRNAIRRVVNEIFKVRQVHIWGEGTTSCAADSKKFGSWDQNLMTEWHSRYGGRGVMIYWHVEKNSTCIYSQLKRCSSSEVEAMIEGVLQHCTAMSVDKAYVDSHGQSEVAFAFSFLLGFQILSNNIEDQELSMLCLHLLQVSLIYVNTLMLQEVLSEPDWSERMTTADWRGLNPLGHAHVTYGNFDCNMKKRIKLKAKAA